MAYTIAVVTPSKLKLKQGQRVTHKTLAGTWIETRVVCVADAGASVYCTNGNYLPVRRYGEGWRVSV